MIRKALDESGIRVIAVKDRKLLTKVAEDFGLGRGEAEAIVLALAEKARVLGIDDKNGINACKLLGVPFTTAIGILVRMSESDYFRQKKFSRNLRGRQGMGVTRNQFLTTQDAAGDSDMTKTMSIRMDRENFEFLQELT